MTINAHYARLACLLVPLCALLGCHKDEIRSYRTPKEAADGMIAPSAANAQQGSVAVSSTPEWQVPKGWSVQKATGMRLASFSAADSSGGTADISVVTFGGTGGDELANVNRWRSQLKLAPIAAEALPANIEALSTDAGDYSVADITADQAEAGKPLQRILGAWLRRSGKVWFFKVMGPAELVGAQKDSFVEFLRSVRFAPSGQSGGRPSAPSNTNDLPRSAAAGPDLSSLPTSTTLPGGAALTAAGGASLLWNAPGDWTVKAAGSMRKGSYALGPGGALDLSITAFPGDVGGPLANVNRWLGQVGLPGIEEAELAAYTSHMEANGLVFFLADTGSKDPTHSQRITAAVVFWQGNSWFFKLTGPTELVSGAKPAFLEFLRTVRAP